MTQESFRIRRLVSTDEDAVVKLFASTFTKRETMQVYLKNKAEVMAKRLTSYFPECTKIGLSYVCEDISEKGTSKIVGFALNENFDVEKASDSERAKVDNIVRGLVLQLHHDLLRVHPELLQEGKLAKPVLRIIGVGIEDGYGNKGIAQNLIKASINLAKLKGYELVFAETTGYVSQRIFGEKLNFKEACSQVYSDFVFKGEKPFENLTSPEKCILHVKYLKDWELVEVPFCNEFAVIEK